MRPLTVRLARNLSQPLTLLNWWQYQRSRHPANDVILVTLPSAGTHWLRTMLAQALIESYDLNERIQSIQHETLIPTFLDKKQRFKYNENINIPRIQHSHAPYSWLFRRRRILFLVRDLRDTLVSHYRVAQPRLRLPEDFSAFIRGETIDRRRHHDLKSRIQFLNSWSTGLQKSYDFKVVHYETLRTNTYDELQDILSFIGLEPLTSKQLSQAVEVGSVGNMKKLENENSERPFQKVSGSPSKYQDYFNENDKNFFTKEASLHLKNVFGYDYSTW
ncbi:sulfotransferase domain-containing protein [Spiribacter roseus]|uniref:sulfotransferase domain-containing protein n=1 Tax=Spiribacter roseus TaxID=1855875 RepID=UPI0013310037|nr:sulfotransferase domain-containing protein [Spiribacter roseus]